MILTLCILITALFLHPGEGASFQHVAVPQTSKGNTMFVTFSHLGVMPNGFGHAHVAFHINVSVNHDLLERGIQMVMRYHDRVASDTLGHNSARAARAVRKLHRMAALRRQIETTPEWTKTVTGDRRERRQVLAAIGDAGHPGRWRNLRLGREQRRPFLGQDRPRLQLPGRLRARSQWRRHDHLHRPL